MPRGARAAQPSSCAGAAAVETPQAQLAEVLADNAQLRERIAAQPLARADVNRLLAARWAWGGPCPGPG
jgi:hypothetical protein